MGFDEFYNGLEEEWLRTLDGGNGFIQYRKGQFIMNYIYSHNPYIYDFLCFCSKAYAEHDRIDCFYNNNNIPYTMDFLRNHWYELNKQDICQKTQ